jgi:hypothetical protein
MREKIIQSIKPLRNVAGTLADDSPAPIGDHDLDAMPRSESPLTPAAVLVPLVTRAR